MVMATASKPCHPARFPQTPMLQPTQPLREAEPAPSARHQFSAPVLRPAALPTRLSSLSPSLLQDLQRFDPSSPQRELLEVLAACLRYTQALTVDLDGPRGQLTLSLFPLESMLHCALSVDELRDGDLALQQVAGVRPANLQPPANALRKRLGEQRGYGPLRPLLWVAALYGARDSLLPELSGQAAYRVAPALNLAGLDVPGAISRCIVQLRRQTCNLGEIARWHDIGTARATRLLNALYLQAGLIVSRTHPAATNEGWAGYGSTD